MLYNLNYFDLHEGIGKILSELMVKSMKLLLLASNDYGAKRTASLHINNTRYQLDEKMWQNCLDYL